MLFNICWKMESNKNENVILIDGENEIFLDELNMEDEIMNGKFSNSTKHNKKVNRRK